MTALLRTTLVIIHLIFSDGTTQDIPVPPPTTTTTTLATRPLDVIGYFGVYDPGTVDAWPRNSAFAYILGGVDVQGPLVAAAKAKMLAAGNLTGKLVFYLSFGDMDPACQCFEARTFSGFMAAHPEWALKDAAGRRVTTNNGGGNRVVGMDIGNAAYVDAWGAAVLAEAAAHGWDGVHADNVNRCNGFQGWSAKPINPRTGAVYTCADYRRDMASALIRLRLMLSPKGKVIFINHGGATSSFDDPLIQQQVKLADAALIEQCVFDGNGTALSEAEWLLQLRYMDYANRNGVAVFCEGYGSVLSSAAKRAYLEATVLLTKSPLTRSGLGQINRVASLLPEYTMDCGVPLGPFECLNASGVPVTTGCPGPGLTYRRRFAKGTVTVNPRTQMGVMTCPH